MPAPNPSARSIANNSRAPRWFLIVAFLALAAYAAFLGRYATTAAGGSDSSGYLNSAKLFAAGHIETTLRVPPEVGPLPELTRFHFQPLGFLATEGRPRLVPTYPTGFPLHLALAGKLLGWSVGPLVIGLGAALGAVILCYLIGRELGLDRSLSSAAAVIFAVCPVVFFTSFQPLSDTLAATWCLAAVFAALRARRHWGWAAACGAAYGIAVLVRPTNLVVLPALIVMVGFDFRRLALAAVSGLPAAIWMGAYNHALYGSALRSGYGAIEGAFDRSWVAVTALHFLHWFSIFLPFVLLPLPFAALARRETRTRDLLGLALWFVSITTVYLFYGISHEDWSCLRFVLPALPALILAALLGLSALTRFFPATSPARLQAIAAVLLITWASVASWYWTRKLGTLYIHGYEDAYAEADTAANTLLPKDALVLTSLLSGSIYFYTPFPVLRWDQISTAEFARYAALARQAGRPVCAVLHESEENDALKEHCPGQWTRLGRVKSVTFWRLADAAAPAAK